MPSFSADSSRKLVKKIIEVSLEQARGWQIRKHNRKGLKEFNVYSLSKGGLKGT